MPIRRYLWRGFRIISATLLVLIVSLLILFFVVSAPPEKNAEKSNEINDVTNLNPIIVSGIYQPDSVQEIIRLIKGSDRKVSIGGARHSMGGQIGTDNSIHLDMRNFDEVISFSKDSMEITVETGITWRKIQEYIDPYDLSVMIMQTYADFTVGGSLSVNVHGRYIGHGPIIHSVRSIKVVLPNGELVEASREVNPEIFSGCIGGYGGLGVIVEATLKLEQNTRVERQSLVMPAGDYKKYFFSNIRNQNTVIFHNGDIYPDDYDEVRAVSYVVSDKQLTVEERLKPTDRDYRFERFAMWAVSELPGGKWIRQNWADPLYYNDEQICFRNYEASYNAMELEPTSREKSTYVLQEYFVPVDHFDSFVPKMGRIFRLYDVNVINVSIRHAHADTLSLLSWAPSEVFCFVVYYKQGTSAEEKDNVGKWTGELIDAALSENGSYYLPYQLHASERQFLEAYPNADKFFRLKQQLDPQNRFSNRLWDKYYKL